MSENTKKILEEALEAHMADEQGTNLIMTGYIIQMQGTSLEDDRELLTACARVGQTSVISLGLLAHLASGIEDMAFGDAEW